MADQGLAPLLAAMEELTDRIDNAESAHGELENQHVALAALTRDIGAGLTSMTEAMEVLQKRLAEREEKTDWDSVGSWAAQADEKQWTALVKWVDWLRGAYVLKAALKPCWVAHPGVVEEIAALWEAWLVARASMRSKPTSEMAYWHDRVLHPTMRSLAGYADYAACSATKHNANEIAVRATDTSLMPKPVAKAAALSPVAPAPVSAEPPADLEDDAPPPPDDF